MVEARFEPFDAPFDHAYRDRLVSAGTMPAAVVCITDQPTNGIYRMLSRGRVSGLPVIDLADLRSGQTPGEFVEYRLRRQLEFRLPRGTLELSDAQSTSPTMSSIGNRKYPHLHRRTYIPCFGVTVDTIQNDRLVPAPRDKAFVHMSGSPQGGKTSEHLRSVFRQITDRRP
jgi:hypothetical protein